MDGHHKIMFDVKLKGMVRESAHAVSGLMKVR